MTTATSFHLNGAPVTLDAPENEPLLYALRNRLQLKATHFGCGLEQCGACVVDVDGAPAYACTLPVSAVAGKVVTTAEMLARDSIGLALMAAFEAECAGQCGYCLSGIMMSAFSLLKRDRHPDRATIVAALDRHLCRCGAHGGILRAVERAAAEIGAAGALGAPG
nr:2Fe-2S iron-sulfur cluster-binding protein [uncultured Dongia sp.]